MRGRSRSPLPTLSLVLVPEKPQEKSAQRPQAAGRNALGAGAPLKERILLSDAGIQSINRALKEARGDFVLLLPAASRPLDGRIEPALLSLRSAVAGMVRFENRGGRCAAWLLRKELTERIGLLDERFLWGEPAMLDYELRAKQAGFAILRSNGAEGAGKKTARRGKGRWKNMRELQKLLFLEKWCRFRLRAVDEMDAIFLERLPPK